MRLLDVVRVSNAVAETRGRLGKVARLAALLSHTSPELVDRVVAFLSGETLQARLGIGPAVIRAASDIEPSSTAELDVLDVERACVRLAAAAGPGAGSARIAIWRELVGRATREEHDFLDRLACGELRQGALERLLVGAVAEATHVPATRVRRAVMLAGSLPPVARAIFTHGAAALDSFVLSVLHPIQPMLADAAPDLADALKSSGPAVIEYKLDGARIQVHKADAEVRVFSRALNDVTVAVPEIVEAVQQLPARELILDGEAIALRPDGSPHPFQVTMRRFGGKLDVERRRADLPLTPFFFDCVYVDGSSLIDEPLARRVAALDGLAPSSIVVPRRIVARVGDAEAFSDAALRSGHEGVMVKSVDAPYAAGRRGSAWLKVKPARTLDLVVLAAEWGSGRRRGWLSNLHLGARDESRGGFVMLGKTFKGLTDEVLAWQTDRFLRLEMGRDGGTVHIRPELVVEIAFNDIQESPHYPGRLALRFARVKRYREDKTAGQADTLRAVQQVFTQLTGLEPPTR